jgi:hypothetical protein
MAHQVAIITPTQKDELVGHEWEPRSYFNPVQDCNNEWVISVEEVQGNINPDFPWVNGLPLTDYCPPPQPPLPPIEGESGEFLGS